MRLRRRSQLANARWAAAARIVLATGAANRPTCRPSGCIDAVPIVRTVMTHEDVAGAVRFGRTFGAGVATTPV